MIINLQSSKILPDGQIIFDWPFQRIDGSVVKSVHLNMVYIKLTHPLSRTDAWRISSNITDKTSANPYQEIGFTMARKNTDYSYYKPTQPAGYKLNRYDLSSVRIYITSVHDITNHSDFDFIKIQIEIPNAWH